VVYEHKKAPKGLRINKMARYGLPDYGMYAALENMGNLVDYGELAARLGSIVTFNREGNMIFWDNFESTPLKWITWGAGPNFTVGYTSEVAFFGGQCVKLVTSSQNNGGAGIIRYLLLQQDTKIGVEIAFAPENNEQTFYILLAHDTGSYSKQAWIRFNCDTQTLALQDENVNWIEIATGLNFRMNKNTFHILKLVIDLKAGKYERILFDREEYNISEYGMRTWNSGYSKAFYTRINNVTNTTEAKTLYLDNFILTQNEP